MVARGTQEQDWIRACDIQWSVFVLVHSKLQSLVPGATFKRGVLFVHSFLCCVANPSHSVPGLALAADIAVLKQVL